MKEKFKPGDHIQIRRPGFYNHHGIYVSDERVIQFGGGIFDKPRAAINAVSLEDFKRGGVAGSVQHGRDSWFTGHHPAADEPWKIVARAEFLLKLQPRLPYNLIGYNCEHVANMCASDGWTESYQIRRYFGYKAITSAVFLFWLGSRSRAKLPLPSWIGPLAVFSFLVTVTTTGTYNFQIKKFWDEIEERWREHERSLSEDPRNQNP